MTYTEKNGTVTVFVEGNNKEPYIKVYFTEVKEVSFDVGEYLGYAAEDLRSAYKSDVSEIGKTQKYEVAGKSLTGIHCVLKKPAESAYRWYLADMNDKYVVQYECVCGKDSEEYLTEALELLVESLKPDANYYSSGSGSSK